MSKELIFRAVLEDGEFKAKLDGISQSTEQADASVNELTASTKALGTQLKAGAGLSEFNKSADELISKLSTQSKVVKQVEADVAALNKQLANSAPGKNQQELKLEVNAANKALKEEVAILKGLESEVKKTSAAKGTLTSQARKLKNELVALELAGKRDTEEFRNLSAEAARLTDAIGGVNEQTKALASGTATLDAVTSGIEGVAGGFAAAQGFAALFGEENEDVQKALLKVQASLAIVNGLQSVFNTLNKNGAFLTIASARANTLTAGTFRALGISVTATSTAFKVLRAALIATGIGAIVAVIGFLAEKFDSVASSASGAGDEVEEFSKKIADLEKTSLEINDRLIDSALDLAVAKNQISELTAENQRAELALNKEIEERLKVAQEITGIQAKSLSEAKALLVAETLLVDAANNKAKANEQVSNSINDATDKALGLNETLNETTIDLNPQVQAEIKAIEELEQQIENIRQIYANRKAERQIKELEKLRETNRQEAEKRAQDEQKVIDAFNALILKGFNDKLDDENKIRNESFERRAALEIAFLALPEKERLRLKEEFDQLILDEEAKLQEKLKNFRLEKERETAEKLLQARIDATKAKDFKLQLDQVNASNKITTKAELASANDLSKRSFEIKREEIFNEGKLRVLNKEDALKVQAETNAQILIADAELKKELSKNEKTLSDFRLSVALEAFQQTVTLVNSLFALQSTRIGAELTQLQKVRDAELENFRGTESQRQAIEERFAAKERALKRKQAQADKNAALFSIAINAATAVTRVLGQPGAAVLIPLIVATAAIQAATVSSQPLPEFEKGGWVGGKRHKYGGTPIEAEKDEFIINRKSAKQYSPFVEAINRNDGSFEKLIFQPFFLPEMNGDRANNIIINPILKVERLEKEMRKTRHNAQAANAALLAELKSNKQQSKRSIWLN
jgi:hypothetical protein